MKAIVFCLAILAATPAAAQSCVADVELVGSETDGTDVIHTFRVSQAGEATIAVTFDTTTSFLRKGRVQSRKSTYSANFSGASVVVERPEKAQFEFDEIASVKIDNIRCAL